MGAGVHVREALAWTRDGIRRASQRGLGFWLVTILIGVLLPAPVAIAVVAARLRRADGSGGSRTA